jgi:molecular chaperone GrpE
LQEMEEEISEVENEEGQIDEEKLKEVLEWVSEDENEEKFDEEMWDKEEVGYKDKFLKLQADFDNYKKRVVRDKEDMIFFLKSDILWKILPRIDDLERIVKSTPQDLKNNPLYNGIISTLAKLLKDLEKLWIKPFNSIWEEIDTDKHEVITVLPWKEANIIIDEFEKGYLIWNRVLRHAKVVVGVRKW